MARTVSVSTLKAKALGIVDEVASRGEAFIITKRNRPVARLVPMEEPASLLASVTFLVGEDELLGPTEEHWDAEPGGR